MSASKGRSVCRKRGLSLRYRVPEVSSLRYPIRQIAGEAHQVRHAAARDLRLHMPDDLAEQALLGAAVLADMEAGAMEPGQSVIGHAVSLSVVSIIGGGFAFGV
jgi:hypothetical protein